MPIDPSIYQAQQPVAFNSPFQTLASIGALRRQQQEIQSAKALEDERRQALKDKQQQDAAAQRFYAVIGNPDVTDENFLAKVKIHAPEHYGTAQKLIDDAKKNAADLAEKTANTARINAAMQTDGQTYIANQGRVLEAAGNTPEAFEMMMKIHETAMPGSKQPNEFRDFVRQHGPDSIAQVAKMMQAQSPAVQRQAAEQPGQVADSIVKQQVAAGTVGGMTPEQQAVDADRNATLKQGTERLKLEAQRIALEKAGKIPDQNKLEQEYRTVLTRAMSSRSGGVGMEDAKVQQANHLLSLFEQTYNPKTGGYDIPRVQLNELAMGLAKMTAGSSPAGEGLMREFQQRTAKGDLAGALTWLTGQPISANTDALTTFLKDSIERQGKTGEQNREGEMAYLRGLAPTQLDEARRKQLEATSLNPLRQIKVLTNQKGERKMVVSTDGGQTWQ